MNYFNHDMFFFATYNFLSIYKTLKHFMLFKILYLRYRNIFFNFLNSPLVYNVSQTAVLIYRCTLRIYTNVKLEKTQVRLYTIVCFVKVKSLFHRTTTPPKIKG